MSTSTPKIYVIHENDAWVEPLRAAFDEIGAPFEEWFLSEGLIDLSREHPRDHRYAAELTGGVLAWLEQHGRKVVNNGRALQLEISKIAQYTELAKFGIRTPRTVAAVGRDNLVAAARIVGAPFITKHNRAGKGLGVKLFQSVEALERHVDGPAFEPSVDGVTLIQQYVEAPKPFITRVEFVGGKFLYAVRVDTSKGFELCPADVCQVGDAFCPADAPAAAPQFEIIDGFAHPIVDRYRAFLAANGIGVAGIEFIVDRHGEVYTYDVNTNTNYNPAAEAAASKSGMRAIAAYLDKERRALERDVEAAPAVA